MRISALFIAAGIMSFHGLLLASDFHFPQPDLSHAKAAPFWVTQYKVVVAKTRNVGVPLLDLQGKALTKPLTPLDWCNGAIEGTFKIDQDGTIKLFNFVKDLGGAQVDCNAVFDANKIKISDKARANMGATDTSRFAPAKGPVGDGVNGYILVPYRTIAVDPKYIHFGDVVFIPKARGYTLRMPDGSLAYHDGYFLAADRGGLVGERHFDIFCGLRDDNCIPSVILSDPHKTVDAYVVTDPAVKQELETLHRLKH